MALIDMGRLSPELYDELHTVARRSLTPLAWINPEAAATVLKLSGWPDYDIAKLLREIASGTPDE